ncbi:MAG: DUF262 domain-containing protein [Deltaproteobacteria bacterium]|nr:DUF262 domain-containing protein [Myxococcales bacterium]MDP3214041.1 DUF262 domain-containing protein [Deltaproteobacteria bacterium]
MTQLIEEVARHRKNIKHEALTYSVSELVNLHRDGEILIRPDFQRLFRWTRGQQSSFVESLILEIPIPPLFFFEADDGKWELLDGLQRMSTIVKFFGGAADVPAAYQGEEENENDWHYENENNMEVPLQLVAGEYLKAIRGLSFSRLPTQLQLNLKRSRLHIIVLKRETHPTYKYEVFKRLNSGGAELEDQELRNCSIRLIGNEFPDYLQNVAKTTAFVEALGLEGEKARNGFAEELALRFFTMKNYGDHFKHDVRDLLTRYMEDVAAKRVSFDFSGEREIFERTWTLIAAAIPGGDAFRAKSKDTRSNQGPFSPTLYELVALGVAMSLSQAEGLSADKLRDKIIDIIVSAKDQGLTGSGSNSVKKTRGRLELARKWLADNGAA